MLYAIRRRCDFGATRLDRDAWAGLEPGRINQRSRQDRIGFAENFGRAVVDASELDSRSRWAPRWHQDVLSHDPGRWPVAV